MPIKIVKETNLDIVENESSTDPESVSPPLPEEKTVEEQTKKRAVSFFFKR